MKPNLRYQKFMPSFLQHTAWIPLRLFMTVFGSLEVKGIENIENIKGNAIIAINHVTEFDPFLIVGCLPLLSSHLPLYFVARDKTFYREGWRRRIYGGIIFRIMGGYPAYAGLNNYEEALRHHLDIIRRGNDVCIYPIGKTHLHGEPVRAKGGVSFLAQATQLPIVPVRVDGLAKPALLNILKGKSKITVIFGSPLYNKDIFRNIDNTRTKLSRSDYEDAASAVMDKITQLS